MKKVLPIIVFILGFMLILPTNVYAVDTTTNNTNINTTTNNSNSNTTKSNNNSSQTTKGNNSNTNIDISQYNQSQNCNTLLGNPSDSNSVAWLIDKILTYATIAGMGLVVVLSSMDFLKVITNGSDDEMAKASRKLAIRLLLAALLFFVPTLTNAMLAIFGLTSDSTCGIQQG